MRWTTTTLALALASTLGAAPLAGSAQAQPRMGAAPSASKELEPVEKKPAMERSVSPKSEAVRPGREIPAHRAQPMRGDARTFETSPQAGPALPNRPLGLVGECSPGFTKELRPDHPHGFYSCGQVASPACSAGYGMTELSNLSAPHQFRYECYEYLDDTISHPCPSGWTRASTSRGYSCTSGALLCAHGATRTTGATRKEGSSQSGWGGGDFAIRYSYTCRMQ